LYLIKPMQACLQRKFIQMIYIKWSLHNQKNLLENKSFYRVYFLNFKGLFLSPISILDYAHKALLSQIIKFFLKILLCFENSFSYCSRMLSWILGNFTNQFESLWIQNAKVIREIKKQRRCNCRTKKSERRPGASLPAQHNNRHAA
jgi:hypothetical protein